MKNIIIYFTLSLLFFSCNSNKGKEITKTEFQHILTVDSIESINTSETYEYAKITKKGGKDKEVYLLRISSYQNFKDSLDILMDSLSTKNTIKPSINNISHVGRTIYLGAENQYWLLLLVIPFILVLYYELKMKRKINKK